MTWKKNKTVFCENNRLVSNWSTNVHRMEAVVGSCSIKKVFLKISQNSQENTCARVSLLIKLQAWGLHRCLPVNFAKFSRTHFFIEHLRWLLLIIWRPSKKEHLFYGTTTSGCFWSSLLLLLITLMFVFDSNSKGFKEFKSSISVLLKSLSSCSFLFFSFCHVFSAFPSCLSFFLVRTNKKDSFKHRL